MQTDLCPEPIILGCGYLGHYLAQDLHKADQSPLCVVNSKQSYDKLLSEAYNVLRVDLDDKQSSIAPQKNADIYYFAPPSSDDEQDHRIDHFLSLCRTNPPRRLVYISTSGVYGDCKGKIVDEQAPLDPLTDRAKRRVYAETAIQHFCSSTESEYIILRVGGIYGPERLPIHRLKDITVISEEEAPASNRIHVADLAKICHLAMRASVKNEIINVSDGHSSSMTDYYFQIADLAKRPRPKTVPLSQAKEKLSPAMYSFINESRILAVNKLNKLLDVQLQFPTLAAGLEDCFNKLNRKKL